MADNQRYFPLLFLPRLAADVFLSATGSVFEAALKGSYFHLFGATHSGQHGCSSGSLQPAHWERATAEELENSSVQVQQRLDTGTNKNTQMWGG